MTDDKIKRDLEPLEEEEITRNGDKFSHCTNLGTGETIGQISRFAFNDRQIDSKLKSIFP